MSSKLLTVELKKKTTAPKHADLKQTATLKGIHRNTMECSWETFDKLSCQMKVFLVIL